MKKILSQSRVIVPLVTFFLVFSFAHSATITSTATGGTWATGSTWIGGVAPGTSDAVIIATTGAGVVQIAASLTQTAAGSVKVNSGAVLNVKTKGTITFGALTIISGGTVTMYRSLSVLGITDISGTINFGSTSTTVRSMTFTGSVILNSGAVWNETTSGAAATFSFGNNFINNAATFTAQNTSHTFTGAAMTISGTTAFVMPQATFSGTYANTGTLTIGTATFTGNFTNNGILNSATLLTVTGAAIILTNNGTVTATTALSGSGGVTNNATGLLNLGGTTGITALIATAVGNTVNYTGAAQTAKVTTYHNLTLSGSGIKTFATTPTVNGKLSLEGTATVTVTGTGVVTYGAAATLQYNKPAAYTATTEEWISPFVGTGGVIITNTGTITAPAGRTIGNGSSLNLQNGLLAAGSNVTMAATSTVNRSEGGMTGTLQGAGAYNVNYTGNAKSTGPELAGSGLNDITINLATAITSLTNSVSAFTVGNNLTIIQGNLILQATNANYTITKDLSVSANGTLTHSVDWGTYRTQISLGGNLSILGNYDYSAVSRAHINMYGAGSKTLSAPNTALSILSLSTGDYSAIGTLTINDNFWAMYGTTAGSFHTNGQSVTAKAAVLVNGGTVYIDGGTFNVTGGLQVGFQTYSGNCIFSSGTLNTDLVYTGDGTRTGTFSQSGGTTNLSSNLIIYPSCSYTCTNSPAINIGGNWTTNGTFTAGASTVMFNGAVAQKIDGTAAAQTFSNFVINKSSNILSVSGNTTTLTVNDFVETSGNFTAPATLNINGNATLTAGIFTAGTNTNITGNWMNNGATFFPGTGTVIFNGVSKTIGGSASTAFYNLGINGTVALTTTAFPALTTVSNALTINGSKNLTINAGEQLTVAGTLTNNAGVTGLVIVSDATGTGSLLHNTTSVNATVQRYMNDADWANWKDGWHFLSSPVAVQAISTNFTTSPAADYDFYCWYEPTNEWVNFKGTTTGATWAAANGSLTNFIVGKGYMAAYNTAGTKQFSGVLNVANVPVSGLTITGTSLTNRSWHLLGNPFGCALTWDGSPDWNLTNISSVAKIWNELNQSYTDISSSSIPATNGFMVQVVSGTGSLTIPANKRAHSVKAFYKSAEDLTHITLLARNLTAGNAQECNVVFNANATPGFDLMYDGDFLAGYGPVFYAVAGNEKLSTNALPELTPELQIPFNFMPNDGNQYQIEFQGLESVPYTAWLLDKKTNTDQNMASNPIYSFSAFDGDNQDRFLLHFQDFTGVPKSEASRNFNVFTANGIITIQSLQQLSGKIAVFDVVARTVATGHVEAGATTNINMQGNTGIYIVSVITSKEIDTTKILVK